VPASPHETGFRIGRTVQNCGVARRQQPIRSAGAVVLAEGDAEPRVLIVHRRRQCDWTLPKGRMRLLESARAAARREVWEETGVRCAEGRCVLDVTWRNGRRRLRRIAYWLLVPTGDEGFDPTHEVAAIAWLPAREAIARLGTSRDRRAVRSAVTALRSAA